MKALPITQELEQVARRVVWFEDPRDALADTIHFVAHAMTYGTHEDMKVLKRYLSDDDLREALTHAPPGVIDPRSWAYWNLKLGRYPTPAMPQRRLG